MDLPSRTFGPFLPAALALLATGCASSAPGQGAPPPPERGPSRPVALVRAAREGDGTYHVEARFADGTLRHHLLAPVPPATSRGVPLPWPSPSYDPDPRDDDLPRLVETTLPFPGTTAAFVAVTTTSPSTADGPTLWLLDERILLLHEGGRGGDYVPLAEY